MSKKQVIALVACVSVFALLCAGAIVGSAAMLLLGNTQGLIGELLSDAELPPLFEKLPSGTDSGAHTEHVPETDREFPESAENVLEIAPLPLETLPSDVTVELFPDGEKTLPEEMYEYFDFDMVQIPSHAGFSRVHKGMRLEIVVNMMGKPHRYIHLTEQSVILLWNTDTEASVMIEVTFGQEEYPTEEDRWDDARVTNVFR